MQTEYSENGATPPTDIDEFVAGVQDMAFKIAVGGLLKAHIAAAVIATGTAFRNEVGALPSDGEPDDAVEAAIVAASDAVHESERIFELIEEVADRSLVIVAAAREFALQVARESLAESNAARRDDD